MNASILSKQLGLTLPWERVPCVMRYCIRACIFSGGFTFADFSHNCKISGMFCDKAGKESVYLFVESYSYLTGLYRAKSWCWLKCDKFIYLPYSNSLKAVQLYQNEHFYQFCAGQEISSK